MHIGWSRFRTALGPIAAIGVGDTFGTVAAAGLLVHLAFGLGWYVALLVATAVAPTDPAVVFSVLGQREMSGRSGTILEGESGGNDPVGIALMARLLTAGGVRGGGFGRIGGEFALQMGVGAAGGRCCGSPAGYRCPPNVCSRPPPPRAPCGGAAGPRWPAGPASSRSSPP